MNTRRQWLAVLVALGAIVATLSNGPQSELITRDADNAAERSASPSLDRSAPLPRVAAGSAAPPVEIRARAADAAPAPRVAGSTSAAPASTSPACSPSLRRDEFPETVVLSARNSRGVVTTGKVEPGRVYRIVVSGSYGWGAVRTVGQERHRPAADAECSSAGDEPATRNAFEATEPGQDPLDVYVNGVQIDWRPVGTNTAGCSPDHVYDFFLVPTSTAALHFVVRDSSYADNLGSLSITITD